MEKQEKTSTTAGEPKTGRTTGHNIRNFIHGLYHHLWIRVIYISSMLFLSLANLLLSWLVFTDLLQQESGLVYDETSLTILVPMLVFNVVELLFFAVDIILWLNILWNETDAWFCVDVGNAFNIFLSELPLALINVFISACHEATPSTNILIKSGVVLGYLLLRSITFTTVYLREATEDSSLSVDGCVDPISVLESMDMYAILGDSKIAKMRAKFFDTVRKKNLRRMWIIVRAFVIVGFFAMLIANILVFNFTFVPAYPGHLEWRRIVRSSNGSLQDVMAERYFHDVEIFLKETEMSTRKWLHLVSLEKIMQLQYIGATEQVGISYVKYHGEIFSLFSQVITHKNKTTDTAMTCWRVLGIDYFREIACEYILNDASDIIPLKKLKIEFTYVPPSAQRRLGIVYYNATRTNKNGTVFHNVPLKLEYFQNTIAHTLGLSKSGGGNDDDAAYSHDGWTSGPFRPMDAYLSDRGPFGKYDLNSGDLVPVSVLWKTGSALCPSTVPTGPQRIV